MRSARTLALCLAVSILASDCAKTSTTAATPFAGAVGLVGVSSPTAQASSAFATRGGATSIASLSTVKAALQAALTHSDPKDCLSSAFTFAAPTLTVSSCYGSVLNYQHHPDGADGSNCSSGFPCFDINQVGIWSASESSGEACAAAKANSTVQMSADVVNSALRAVAGLVCAAKALGFHEPGAGGNALDLTSAINTAVDNANFSAATIRQLPARTGAVSTWQTKLLGTVGTQTIELNLLHAATAADNSAFAGHFFGVIGDGTDNFAFSLTYQQTAQSLTTLTKFGTPSAVTADPFDVNNDLDFNHALLNGEPVFYTLASVDPKTGLGTANISWMDDNRDAYARSLQLVTTAGLSADAGVAYFGFSAPLTSATGRAQISKLICNWGGPGANNNGLSGQAEAQHFTRGTTGIFAADQNAITFAPTNSCAYTPGTFELAVSPDPPAAITAVTPQLVHFNGATGVGDWGNIAVLTEPTY